MAKAHIPQQVDELTESWFTDVLGDPGQVTSVDITTIGTDIGFMGELYRCALSWDEAAGPEAPSSVIVKVPSRKAENRALGEGMGAYEREIEVYTVFADGFGVPMPAHHHSTMDPNPAPWAERGVLFLFEKLPMRAVGWLSQKLLVLAQKNTRRYLLVIEDIADARPPTQAVGGSLDDSIVALETLAAFHATNWGRTGIVEDKNRILPLNTTPKILQGGYARNREAFVERFADIAGPGVMERLDATQDDLVNIVNGLCEAPCTVLHGDYRLDNVLFRSNGDVTVIDFQAVTWGRPGFDVAYFITTALTPDHRDEEERLLRVYHEALVVGGVSDYSFEQLVADCEATKAMLAHRFVGGRDMVDTDVAGSDQSFLDLLATRVLGWIAA